jgi:hypothetical protein
MEDRKPIVRFARQWSRAIDASTTKVWPQDWSGAVDPDVVLAAAKAGALDPEFGDAPRALAYLKDQKRRRRGDDDATRKAAEEEAARKAAEEEAARKAAEEEAARKAAEEEAARKAAEVQGQA